MNIDINNLGYRWKGVYSPYLSYLNNDVVYKDGGAYVMRNGVPTPFALGQQDAVLAGHVLTGGVSVGGLANMVLHSNGASGMEFRFMGGRNGTIATALMSTERASCSGYGVTNYYMGSIMSDGSVRMLGLRQYGQTGTGVYGGDPAWNYTFPSTVAFPPGTPRITQVISAFNDTYYLDASGVVWHSGSNQGDTMSGRNTTSYIPVPQKINGFGDLGSNTIVKKIYIGRCYHGYPSIWLLDNQGRVYSWGYNQYGQLGNGNSTNQNVPKLVPMSVTTPIKDIYVTGGIYAASFLIGTNGILYAAGETNSSLLTSNASTHQPVMPWGWNKTVKKIFSCETPGTWEGAGTYRRYGAVLDNGELWMWGDQGGYVGDGFGIGYGPASFQGNTIFPIKCLDGVKDAQAVAAGYHMSLALMNDGTVKWTGYNGQYIGGSSGISRTTWETLGASYLTNVTKLRLYGYSTYQTAVALRSDGKVVVWGFGGSGQVGNGNNLTPNAPNSFLLLDKTVVDFSVSGYFGAGSGALYCLTSDGQVMVNGYGAHSMDGDDDQESRFAPSPVIF